MGLRDGMTRKERRAAEKAEQERLAQLKLQQSALSAAPDDTYLKPGEPVPGLPTDDSDGPYLVPGVLQRKDAAGPAASHVNDTLIYASASAAAPVANLGEATYSKPNTGKKRRGKKAAVAPEAPPRGGPFNRPMMLPPEQQGMQLISAGTIQVTESTSDGPYMIPLEGGGYAAPAFYDATQSGGMYTKPLQYAAGASGPAVGQVAETDLDKMYENPEGFAEGYMDVKEDEEGDANSSINSSHSGSDSNPDMAASRHHDDSLPEITPAPKAAQGVARSADAQQLIANPPRRSKKIKGPTPVKLVITGAEGQYRLRRDIMKKIRENIVAMAGGSSRRKLPHPDLAHEFKLYEIKEGRVFAKKLNKLQEAVSKKVAALKKQDKQLTEQDVKQILVKHKMLKHTVTQDTDIKNQSDLAKKTLKLNTRANLEVARAHYEKLSAWTVLNQDQIISWIWFRNTLGMLPSGAIQNGNLSHSQLERFVGIFNSIGLSMKVYELSENAQEMQATRALPPVPIDLSRRASVPPAEAAANSAGYAGMWSSERAAAAAKPTEMVDSQQLYDMGDNDQVYGGDGEDQVSGEQEAYGNAVLHGGRLFLAADAEGAASGASSSDSIRHSRNSNTLFGGQLPGAAQAEFGFGDANGPLYDQASEDTDNTTTTENAYTLASA